MAEQKASRASLELPIGRGMQSLTANPARLVAVVAGVAVLAGGMLVFKTTRGGPSTASSETPHLLHQSVGLAHAHKPATATHVAMRGNHPHTRAVHRTAVAPSGLPWKVQDALSHNSVVVVAVVTSKTPVDQMTLAEAQAGAKSAKAGFVRVNAYSQRQIGPFDSVITVSANPAILVMHGPKTVTLQVPGYADRQSVMQAVDDARILKATTAAQ